MRSSEISGISIPLQVFSMAVIALLVLYFGLNPSPVLDMMINNSEAIVSLAAVMGV